MTVSHRTLKKIKSLLEDLDRKQVFEVIETMPLGHVHAFIHNCNEGSALLAKERDDILHARRAKLNTPWTTKVAGL